MSLFEITIASSLLSTLLCGCTVFICQPKRVVNQSFFLLSCIIGLWLGALWGGATAKTNEHAEFWIRQTSAISALIPVSMCWLYVAILHPLKKIHQVLFLGKTGIIAWMLIAFICQTPLFLTEAKLPVAEGMVAIPEYGKGFGLFIVYFLIAAGNLFYRLLNGTRKAKGVKKIELGYMLLSCGLSLIVGIFFLVLPNVTGQIDLGAFLPLSVITFTAITGYGIATKGILDVSVVARRITAYIILIIYLSFLYSVSIFVFSFVITHIGFEPEPLVYFLASIVVVFSTSSAKGVSLTITNKLFITSPTLNVGEILSTAGRCLNTVLTVEELCQKFQVFLSKNLETSDLHIFAREKEHYIQIFPLEPFRQIPLTASIPTYLEEHQGLCVQDLLYRRRVSPEIRTLVEELKKEKASAAIGFQRKNMMSGFMYLGPRSSGRVYTQEETIAIQGLRDLFAVSYENAQLYTELQNGRIYMDLLLKNLVNGVLATDASGSISTCNQEASRILGTGERELIGKSIHRLPEELYKFQQSILDHDRIIRDKEIILNANTENPVYINVGASLFRDLKGNVIGSLLVLQDRTAIRNLEEQVKRSERLASLGTLSAGMAHEIKNPLVTLKTFTQLLPERFHDVDYRETFVNLASKEINRIDGLVNKLLTLARPVKLELSEIRLNCLLEKYSKLFREQAKEMNIEVIEAYHADPDVILGDDDQLHQVVLNLLLNAQQAMPDGGKIELSTRNLPGYIELQIRDTGEGISPENQNHVFDPFFTTKSAGTGLGLAVAHQILEEHQALVKVESSPGEGTAFIIQLPSSPPEDTP